MRRAISLRGAAAAAALRRSRGGAGASADRLYLDSRLGANQHVRGRADFLEGLEEPGLSSAGMSRSSTVSPHTPIACHLSLPSCRLPAAVTGPGRGRRGGGAKEATSTIPIVFFVGPTRTARPRREPWPPGGNATGDPFLDRGRPKRLELLRERLPQPDRSRSRRYADADATVKSATWKRPHRLGNPFWCCRPATTMIEKAFATMAERQRAALFSSRPPISR